MVTKHNLSLIIILFLILSINPVSAVETSLVLSSKPDMGPSPDEIETNSSTGPESGSIESKSSTGPESGALESYSSTGPEPGSMERPVGAIPTFNDLEGFHKEFKTGHSSGIETKIIPVAATVAGVITGIVVVVATGGLATPLLVACVGSFWASVITCAAVGAASGAVTALTQGILEKDNIDDVIKNIAISTLIGAAIGAVTGGITEAVPKIVPKVKVWWNNLFDKRFPGAGYRLGGTSQLKTVGMSRPTHIIPHSSVMPETSLATSPSQAVSLSSGPVSIHTLPTTSACNEIGNSMINHGLQTVTLVLTPVQEVITPTIATLNIINPTHIIVGTITTGLQIIRGVHIDELNRRFPENTQEVINWLNNVNNHNYMTTTPLCDINRENLNWIRTQIHRHYFGNGLLGGMRNNQQSNPPTPTPPPTTTTPTPILTATTTSTPTALAMNNEPRVLVTDGDGHPIHLEGFILNPSRANGQYMTINQALTALKHLDLGKRYIITLYDSHYREYIRIPRGLNVEFIADNPVVIDGICVEPGAQVTFNHTVKFQNIIGGEKYLWNGQSYFIKPDDHPMCGGVCDLLRLQLLAHHLTRHYLTATEHMITELIELLNILDHTTHNEILRVRTGTLREQLRVIHRQVQEKLGELPTYELEMFHQIEDDPETLKLVQIIDTPIQCIPGMISTFCHTYILPGNMFTNISHNAQPRNNAYITFTHRLLHLIDMLLHTNHQTLGNLIKTLEGQGDTCIHTIPLARIDQSFNRAMIGFTGLNTYVTDLGDHNEILAEGEHSSQTFLFFVEEGLKTEHRIQLREALIQFLNKEAHTNLTYTITDKELIDQLKTHLYNIGCKDAESFIQKFQREHPLLIRIIFLVIGIGSFVNGIDKIGGLVSKACNIT